MPRQNQFKTKTDGIKTSHPAMSDIVTCLELNEQNLTPLLNIQNKLALS